jgi:hypothetical protein
MRRLILSAFSLMTVIAQAQSQGTTSTATVKTGSGVSFGIKAGVNVASLKDNQTSDIDPRTGFHAGLLANIPLSGSFRLQPEITYSSQGAKYNTLGEEKVNYVNIPILLQYQFPGGFRLQTGPQLGLLTDAKLERLSGGETDVKDQFSTADVSWAFGAAYLTPLGLGIDARYNLGLNNVVDTDLHTVKNQVWQFGLFYQFGK